MVKRKLSQNDDVLDLLAIFVPTRTYGHELSVVTERTRWWVETAKMSFLSREAGLRRVRSFVIQEKLGVEPLLLSTVC